MKVLHTSDWHLGTMFGPQKRYDEFEKTLDWLLETIKSEQIEALLIAGDVFDTNLPSNRATEQYYRFLAQARLAGIRNVIVTAGNHDSASFLEAPGGILKHLDVYVIGKIDPAQPENAVIPLKDADGKVAAVVCAVPHMRDSDIRKAVFNEDFETQENRRLENVLAYYQAVCSKAEELYPQAPIIATGHFFAEEANYYNSLHAIPVAKLPKNISYLALGHLHAFQQIKSHSNAWYSGSLLQMNFKEQPEEKKVLIFDTDHPDSSPQEICIPSFQRIEIISGSFDELKNNLKMLAKTGESVWVHAVNTGDFVVNLQLNLSKCCADSSVKLISCDNTQLNPVLVQHQQTTEKLEEITPEKIFSRLVSKIDEQDQKDLLDAFRETMKRLVEDDVNAE